jgi:FAD/FMN-containing dehydrogenase/Fe-S oxidoreductase
LVRGRSVERVAEVDARALETALRGSIAGEVRFDAGSRALYAHDGSNYRHVPLGVCIPRTLEDVEAIVAASRAHGASIVSRAGGTALAGQTVNDGLLIDWSKYLHGILELDPVRRLARVLPGTICDVLAEAAWAHDLTYGPQPATHSRCCFGGMLSNNSCGIHAQMAGKAADNTEAMEVLLYDGTRLRLGWTTDAEAEALAARPDRVGDVHRRLLALRRRYGALVEARYPKIPRRVSGYNLDALHPDREGRWNLARALVGSEGTCVTMLDMTVRLVPARKERVLVVLGYPDVYRAADDVEEVLASSPIGLEAMDARLLHHVRMKHDPEGKYLHLLPPGEGWLFVEFGAERREEARTQAEDLIARLSRRTDGARRTPTHVLVTRPEEQRHLFAVREAGLGATAFVPGRPDTWEGWEDSAVAPEKLGGYLRDLRDLLCKFEYDTALYGHFGMGCVHARIDFDPTTTHGAAKWRRFLESATDLIVRHGGSFSGEHGDGQSRAEFLYKMFGPELIEAFREFKAIWDPLGRMNPGKIVDARRATDDLRLLGWPRTDPETHFGFADDHGSFAHATLRCVGIGECRRLDGHGHGDRDTMCPSFMVTREEMHSTRGRAHLLFEMLERGPLQGGWRDEHVKEALDLCLSCKGCKGDCPVHVDVATYKAEFLAHYYEGRLRPRSAYAFGLIDRWASLASLAPGLANLVTQTPLSALAKAAAGVAPARSIPPFAPRSFRSWFAGHRRRRRLAADAERVMLWPDTFHDRFFPDTAIAAVRVLEDAGFAPEIPTRRLCCGRPLYDYGMLGRAKRYLRTTLDGLRAPLAARTPIVVLEPSCASVFRDELCNLLPNDPHARVLREQVTSLAELLDGPRTRARGWRPPRLARRAIVQGHCHQKALARMDADRRVLGAMGIEAEVLESGCCGMAGAFGYEKDKYGVSIACGERRLLPAVREAEDTMLIVADGFSCREQIAQETQRRPLHLAEVLALGLEGDPGGRAPELARWEARRRGARRSMWRAALGLTAVGVAALGLLRVSRRRA